MRSFVPIALAILLSPSLAVAQLGNPAGMSPKSLFSEPGRPGPEESNTQDQLFVQLAGSGGMAEVSTGRLADGKTQHAAVRDFARRMVQDHGATNDRLKSVAAAAAIPLPPRLLPDHEAMAARLDGLTGAQFDLAYLQGQVIEHQKTAQILEWEMSMGQHVGLQRLAADALPIVLQHLGMAQALLGDLTGAGPQGLAVSAPRGPAPR